MASVVAILTVTTLLTTASPASAATPSIPLHMVGTSTQTVPVGVAAVIPLDPVSQAALNFVCAFDPDCPNGLWGVGVDVQDVNLDVTFEQDVAFDATYTDGLLSEGKTLDVVDAVSPQSGSVQVTAHVSGNAGAYVDGDPFSVDPFNATIPIADVPCTVPAPGGPTSVCDLPPADLTIVSLPMFPGIGVDLALRLDASVNVDSTGLATVREYKVVSASDTDPLTFSGSSLNDPYDVPCGPAGQDLMLNLSDSALDVDPSLPADLQLVIKWTVFGETVDDTVLTSAPLGSVDFPVAPLSDAGVDSADLGTIAQDSEPPVVTGVASHYSGDEGSELAMSATVDDACGADDVVWKFSDGGTEYGPTIQKVFADSGNYTGNVTATDFRGNKTVKNFTVTVTNVAPVADAGPDGSAAWGRLVAFNGAGTDRGLAEPVDARLRVGLGGRDTDHDGRAERRPRLRDPPKGAPTPPP